MPRVIGGEGDWFVPDPLPSADPPPIDIPPPPVPWTNIRIGSGEPNVAGGDLDTPSGNRIPLVYGRRWTTVQVKARSGDFPSSGTVYETATFGICLGPISSIEGWRDKGTSAVSTPPYGPTYSFSTVLTGFLATGSCTKLWGPGYEAYANGDNAIRLSADVKGRTVYDPRLDTVPGAHPTNASYIAWTDNPACCAADFLTSTRYGRGISTALVDWQSVADVANWCDAIVGGAKRFTLNITFGGVHTVADIENMLLLHFGGKWVQSGGLWRLVARSGAGTTVATIGSDDYIGVIRAARSRSAASYNRVVGEYVDSAGATHLRYAQTLSVEYGAGTSEAGLMTLHGLSTAAECDRALAFILGACVLDMEIEMDLLPEWMHLAPGDMIEVHAAEVVPLATPFLITWVGRSPMGVQVRAAEWDDASFTIGSGPASTSNGGSITGGGTVVIGAPQTTALPESAITVNRQGDPAPALKSTTVEFDTTFGVADLGSGKVRISGGGTPAVPMTRRFWEMGG